MDLLARRAFPISTSVQPISFKMETNLFCSIKGIMEGCLIIVSSAGSRRGCTGCLGVSPRSSARKSDKSNCLSKAVRRSGGPLPNTALGSMPKPTCSPSS